MKRSGFILSILAILFIAPNFISAQNLSNRQLKKYRNQVFEMINDYRTSHGLSELTFSDIMNKTAQSHSDNMADGSVPFSHEGFDKRYAYLKAQMPGFHACAENVAYGDMTPEEAVAGWLKSPGHLKNLSSTKYNQTGIGVQISKEGYLYYTQMFAN
jgi:uncharacterized protein YkwD